MVLSVPIIGGQEYNLEEPEIKGLCRGNQINLTERGI
jgi:hypothetical protein